MNVVLLTAIIFAVALVHGAQGQRLREPCQQRSSNIVYTTFVHRHILNDNNLDTNSRSSWENYLERKRLCGRVRVQSFIDASASQVHQICRYSGRRVVDGGNLCISDSSMTVYDVRSQRVKGQCRVTRRSRRQQKVVVACDKVGNLCLPVHYEAYRYQHPTNQRCS